MITVREKPAFLSTNAVTLTSFVAGGEPAFKEKASDVGVASMPMSDRFTGMLKSFSGPVMTMFPRFMAGSWIEPPLGTPQCAHNEARDTSTETVSVAGAVPLEGFTDSHSWSTAAE
jgi:hypothetical protein